MLCEMGNDAVCVDGDWDECVRVAKCGVDMLCGMGDDAVRVNGGWVDAAVDVDVDPGLWANGACCVLVAS